jgi:hypothetical protein
MRIPLAVTAISVAMLGSPLAYGQAPSAKSTGPAARGGARPVTAPTQPTVPPASDTLKNLAGGGYADPNYVPPGTHSEKTTRHCVARSPRTRMSHRYGAVPASPYRFCYCYCDY